MKIECAQTAQLLQAQDDILILSHRLPDGDTLGSASALLYALLWLGKRVRFLCSDPVPYKFEYLFASYQEVDFVPQFIVSVDVAHTSLLGERSSVYADRIDLAIDHHRSDEEFARYTQIDSQTAATCELVFDVIAALGVPFTPLIASCLYTGMATDTGCFKFSNTTASTHYKAGKLFECGADTININRVLFEVKTRSRIYVERYALDHLVYFGDNRCAVIYLPLSLLAESGADDSELDGVSSLPKSIEGVDIGITIREREDGSQKISLRTSQNVDASAICAEFGGGGHIRAAGCTLHGSKEEAQATIVSAAMRALSSMGAA